MMMPRPRILLLLLPLVGVFAASTSASETAVGDGDGGQVYIVYLGHLASPDQSESEDGVSAVEFAHHDLLNQVLDDSSSASDRILRSYKRSLNGFAARLTKQEAHELSSMDGVVSVFPSMTYEPLTTRSWDFLGFPQTPKDELPLEGDIIVGMLDTGIWPDSPSFSDDGFGPPPSKWKGVCQNFTCNNKIIGARAYRRGSSDGLSPLDDEGHGSHTASTVAGRAVGNVSFDGLAAGVARGAVPGARLAVYKVCWSGGGCGGADILAAFDDAIADGVDVISFSIGGPMLRQYFLDVAAIGSFHAMRRGVVTSTAAGNSGLSGGRVCNVAPWMLSVAASSIDRRFTDRIVLGNGETIVVTDFFIDRNEYLGHLPELEEAEGFAAVELAHHDLLNQVLDDDGSSASDRILRSYKRSFNGFAARLTEQEADKLSSMDGIVSVFPSRTHKLLTTRSWDFLGLPQTPPEELPLEGDVIIGMLDGGIWPDSPSFSDDGFGPPPSRWKGVCQNFTCNNKIIGARAYNQGSSTGLSPLDEDGHGSHTASTAAGRAVGDVSFGGLAAGTARGAVPGARLAVYKVCWECWRSS
ncbi:cucumisin-like [Panicum virgatum]|uniref:cucumisin-like n=1 Tax=Panicum virgatum TaxID=38727 RepID=UPI0019D616B8|nr:cucumisin-like [Panicum virgatum]